MEKIQIDLGIVEPYVLANYVIELKNLGNTDLYIENIITSEYNHLQALTYPIILPQNEIIQITGDLQIVQIATDVTTIDATIVAYYYDENDNKIEKIFYVEYIYHSADKSNKYQYFTTQDIDYINNLLIIVLNSSSDLNLILKSLNGDDLYILGKKIKYSPVTYAFVFHDNRLFRKAVNTIDFLVQSLSNDVEISNIAFYTI